MHIEDQSPSAGAREPFLNLVDEIRWHTPGDSRLQMCIQCGTCGGSCPSGADMDHSPRQLFALLRAGIRERVLKSNTPWYCVSCYFCMARCPQEVHITDIMYTLKRMAIAEGYAESEAAPDFSRTFVDDIESYGRSYEFGLATRHHLKHRLSSMASAARLGLGMLSRDRMDLAPQRIEGLDQLQAILERAKEMEAEP